MLSGGGMDEEHVEGTHVLNPPTSSTHHTDNMITTHVEEPFLRYPTLFDPTRQTSSLSLNLT